MSNNSLDEFEQQIAREIKINADGKASASIRATARLAGVSDSTLGRSLQSSASKNPTKLAQLLMEYGFDPASFSQNGVPDTAVGLIVKYYAWMAGERCNVTAKQTDMLFGAFGTRTWMQKVTGWRDQKSNNVNSVRDFVIAQLPEKPSNYQVRYPKRFWDALLKLYALKQGHRGCAPFINAYIYNFFPVEVRKRLDEINPLFNDGTRQNKQHQHFDDILLQALIQQIERVITALQMSPTREEFRANMARLKPYQFAKDTSLKIEGNDNE